MNTTTVTRENASQYDLLVVLDEVLKADFAHLEDRVDRLQAEFEAHLDLPTAMRKHEGPGRTLELDDQLRAARNLLLDTRQWHWTRRVPGYAAGKMLIAEA